MKEREAFGGGLVPAETARPSLGSAQCRPDELRSPAATVALTIDPEIQADLLAEAKDLAEEIEAYVSEQLRDEMGRHDFDAPDDAEASMVFTFGHYRKLGRIVSLLRDLSLSIGLPRPRTRTEDKS